jgi:uncharacterized Zn finger protein
MSSTGVRTEVRRWWGERVLSLLDDAGAGAARRVQRGQALARRGAVDDLVFAPGEVRAGVTEDRGRPNAVTIRWTVPSDEAWAGAERALAQELRFIAALLEGELTAALVETLESAGVALLPSLDELTFTCTCPERAALCRHVAAVHTLTSVQIDRDPTLLLTLRGRDREELLSALRRGDGVDEEAAAALDLSEGFTAARGDLDTIVLHPAPVEDPAALLRQLGPPPGVEDEEPLAALIDRAAAAAWRLAAGDGAAAADEELLLAELRAHRVVTAAALAEALGRDEEAVRAELDRLFETGAVLRTGSGERTRYRAASA